LLELALERLNEFDTSLVQHRESPFPATTCSLSELARQFTLASAGN
jgi:hypothetical protein